MHGGYLWVTKRKEHVRVYPQLQLFTYNPVTIAICAIRMKHEAPVCYSSYNGAALTYQPRIPIFRPTNVNDNLHLGLDVQATLKICLAGRRIMLLLRSPLWMRVEVSNKIECAWCARNHFLNTEMRRLRLFSTTRRASAHGLNRAHMLDNKLTSRAIILATKHDSQTFALPGVHRREQNTQKTLRAQIHHRMPHGYHPPSDVKY